VPDEIELNVGERVVRVTHPDRVIWPLTGTTKRDLIAYLLEIAPVLLPYLRDRATMLWRFPEGIDGPGWFQAECRSRPPWVGVHQIVNRAGRVLPYCVVDEPATLVWLANLGTIELHPHGWTVDAPTVPTSIVFDLDPGPPAGLAEAAVVALEVRTRLLATDLKPVVKTSGGAGLHVAARLPAGWNFAAAKSAARALARDLAADMPNLVIERNDRAARAGRVYVDWIQNDRNRQLIAPYSPRATPTPAVSTPLAWSEVEAAAGGDLRSLRPTFAQVVERTKSLGDAWAARAAGA
jgi:bifunctional non-homologous end joining protein LigD